MRKASKQKRSTTAGALMSVCMAATLLVAGCKTENSSRRQTPAPAQEPAPSFQQSGEASWYGPGFHGRRTASGETFNQNDLTAAHRTLPLGSKAEVTDVETGKSVQVTINDRGPYVKNRVIDLSKAAAKKLGITKDGTSTVRIAANPPEKVAAARK
jgi:rare lipoprotein A